MTKMTIDSKTALISLIIMLLGILITGVTIANNTKAEVNQNSESIMEFRSMQSQINKITLNHEKRLVTLETHYDHIHDSLKNIEEKLD